MVTEAARKAVAAAYTELSEELLEERVAMAEELAQKQRELKAAWEKSDATVRVAASLEQAKEAAEVEKKKASAALRGNAPDHPRSIVGSRCLATLQRLVQPVDRRAFAHARLTDRFENAAQVGGRIGSVSVDLSSDSFELEERDGAHFGWAARCC